MRYTLQVQYIGKNYAGSQIQFENGKEIETPTVQGELEKALGTLIKSNTTKQPRHCVNDAQLQDCNGVVISDSVRDDEKLVDANINRRVKTVFSGRTDRGVNSQGQVVHFDTDKSIVASKFVYQLNEILPKEISVSDLQEVDERFHAQKSAKRRYYRYIFVNRKCKNAFDGDLLRVKFDVDIDRMNEALSYLLGEHDFSSFKSSGTLNPSKVCFIEKAVASRDGDMVIIDIVGNRFLYNMVRTIVGTLLEIEGHNRSAEYMKQVLEACDRRKAGHTVSPYGLTLMKVEY